MIKYYCILLLMTLSIQKSQGQYFKEMLKSPDEEHTEIMFRDTSIALQGNTDIELELEMTNNSFCTIAENMDGLEVLFHELSSTGNLRLTTQTAIDEAMLTLKSLNCLGVTDSLNVDIEVKFINTSDSVIVPVLWKINKAYPGIDQNGTLLTASAGSDAEMIYSTAEKDISIIEIEITNNSNKTIKGLSLEITSLLELKKDDFRDSNLAEFKGCEPSQIILLLDNSSSVDTIQKAQITQGIYQMLDSLAQINTGTENEVIIFSSSVDGSAAEIASVVGGFQDIKQDPGLQSALQAWVSDTITLATNLTALVKSAKQVLDKEKESLILQIYNGYENGESNLRKPRHVEINRYLKEIDKLQKKEGRFVLLSYDEMDMSEAESMSALIHGSGVYTDSDPENFQKITYYHNENPQDLFQLFSSAISKSCLEPENRSTMEETKSKSDEVLKVHPNPASNEIVLELQNYDSEAGYLLQIHDMNGQLQWKKQLQSQRIVERIGEDYPKGQYFITVWRDGRLIDSQKLIIH